MSLSPFRFATIREWLLAVWKIPLSRSLIVLGIIILIGLLVGATREIILMREVRIREAERQVERLAMVFAGQTSRAVESAYFVLKESIKTIETMVRDNKAEPLTVNDELRRRMSGVPQVSMVLITDQAGKVIYSSRAPTVSDTAIAHSSFLQGFVQDATLSNVTFSGPIREADGEWIILLAQRFNDNSSQFQGVAIAAIHLKYFEDIYSTVELDNDSVIVLYRRDGIVLVRHPHNDDVIGKSYADTPPFTQILSQGSRGAIVTNGLIDGGRRIAAVEALKLFPLVIDFSMAAAPVFESWRDQAIWFGIATIIAGTLIVFLTILFAYQSHRREKFAYEIMMAKNEAERASQIKSEFLANMSHELRTPLNAVIGFSELIVNEINGPLQNAEYAQFVRHILNSGRHLLSVINDVLDMSKLEAGRVQLLETTFMVRETIEGAMNFVSLQAQSKNITIDSKISPNDVAVRADSKLLRQILLNLLSNAVKFTPEGGRIRVEVECSNESGLVLRVADTGIGIPEDALTRVFTPFEQVNSSLSRQVEGTGLGLSITRGLVELHGGTILLESAVGKGTVVTVTLPASRVVSAN